jgi:hypothetical protein
MTHIMFDVASSLRSAENRGQPMIRLHINGKVAEVRTNLIGHREGEVRMDLYLDEENEQVDCDPHRTVTYLENGVPFCYMGHAWCWDAHYSERASDEADMESDLEQLS